MEATVFYSWQSDLDGKLNRYFIRDCLKDALRKLSAEPEYGESVRIDSDTAGVPGTPDIAFTIFKKIDSSQVFIADISFCATSADGQKKFPNSNVMIELGYALARNSDAGVLNIMNTAYGKPDDLPFDLKHKRWPIQYELTEEIYSDSAKRKDVKDKLTNELYNFVKIIIDASEVDGELPRIGDTPSLAYIEKSIINSDSAQDWDVRSVHFKTVAVYRNDVNLRIEIDWSEDGVQCEDFKEPWANCHPDRKASGHWVDIFYGVSHIISLRSIIVNVDGARASLPIPRQKGVSGSITEVLPLDYKYAKIFDTQGTLDEYMWRSKLTLAI
ncbi:hypothetical protein [Pseudomonas sp. B28(2017)]|uniref:hypothetical protein n=1 Tax=Pseudomonas sp. B28(2017) TaxID=1981730 RepID=UPI00117B95C1|nr:hypothetical protein [Pseudomonas sp. B28(2017)]